jgi:cytochrome c553
MASSARDCLLGRRRISRRRLFPARAGRGAIAVAVLAAAVLSAEGATAGDVKAGRAIAETKCAVCHGLDGVAKIAEAPNLAGQNEGYLATQLGAFKAGARQNEMMSIVIEALTDADIANLAAYYSAIEVKIGKLPGD